MKILVTGLSGLVGSRLSELLGNKYQFENLSRVSGIDITDEKVLAPAVKASNAKIVIHLAAKTNVDGCQEDKVRDQELLRKKDKSVWINQETAWAVNVIGTENILKVCGETGKKIIYISTDFVFDGNDDRGYDEDDIPNPLNWYAKTKYEGEKLVANSGLDWIIARLAYPFRAEFEKKDFVRAIKEKLEKGEKINAISDHVMTPTFIDDFVGAIDLLISSNSNGIFHTVGSQFITPLEAARFVAKTFELDESLITQTTRTEYFKAKAVRPFFLGLKNDKINKMGAKMRTFEAGINEIRKQIL